MNYKQEYENRLITVDRALAMVESDIDICVSSSAAEPMDFMNRLHEVAGRVKNVNVLTCLSMGDYRFAHDPEMRGHFTNASWFYTAPLRRDHPLGTISFIPSNSYRAAADRLKYRRPHIFVGSAASMDKHGYLNISLSASYEREFIENSDIVILEVNDNYPVTNGDTYIHISDVDFVYESNRPIPVCSFKSVTDRERIIGHYIADLVDDGATIQLGIGSIPNAAGLALREKRELGVHTELMTEMMMELYEEGIITNKRKTINKGKFSTSMIFGSDKLYKFVDRNPGVEVLRGSYINDPKIVAQNYKMTSINTTLEIDLTGQCASESLGHTLFSGTGGQADIARGSQESEGGKSIIALYSTYFDKNTEEEISKIVPFLAKGAGISLQRNDVDYVVTEYGVAQLRGRTIKERVNNLIAIAHPNFRAELRREADRYMLW